MARAGIIYSHVAKAAAALVAEGKNPTVDTIRAALGDTGSKSTIAPLLKRWKAEHQEDISQTELGMPTELISAVKHVYEKIQDEARLRIEEAQIAHDAALQLATDREQQSEAKSLSLSNANATLSAKLENSHSELMNLQTTHHELIVKFTGMESENIGLQQRLIDRAAEVATLNQQISQAGRQFEHFQEAAAAQRLEARRATEQRIAHLEQENTNLQRELSSQQRLCTQHEVQLANLSEEKKRLQEASRDAQEQVVALRCDRDHLAYQVKELTSSRHELRAELATAQQTLAHVRTALAAQEKETSLIAARLVDQERKVDTLESERMTLIHENAALRAAQDAASKVPLPNSLI